MVDRRSKARSVGSEYEMSQIAFWLDCSVFGMANRILSKLPDGLYT